ncbi:universal stress protein [Sphingomonas sp. H39-1-10]|uniref:universal stress protein n=1 Tax=Sphingomonas pollutisoli TaxID=3030829 RepID=UPI0023B8F71F|nr:universal stress protein [Sphingomonas pollutisoli]MDF0490541.1 universal stress protein [Sphingomonas pollutisoli]
MFRRIVHANDGSENSLSALRAAIDLARLAEATLDVILVAESFPNPGLIAEAVEHDAAERRRIQRRKTIAERVAQRRGVKIAIHVFAGHPVERIVQFAFEQGADLLVIGATEHVDLWERIFGRRSDRMTHQASCSVLIVREGGHDAF